MYLRSRRIREVYVDIEVRGGGELRKEENGRRGYGKRAGTWSVASFSEKYANFGLNNFDRVNKLLKKSASRHNTRVSL